MGRFGVEEYTLYVLDGKNDIAICSDHTSVFAQTNGCIAGFFKEFLEPVVLQLTLPLWQEMVHVITFALFCMGLFFQAFITNETNMHRMKVGLAIVITHGKDTREKVKLVQRGRDGHEGRILDFKERHNRLEKEAGVD